MTSHRWGGGRWLLVALLLLAWALRLPPALANPLHPDEALYGYWGLLIGRGGDPWLATVPVYKPPLLPYLVAGSQALLGNSELAVRLPGLMAGLVTIPLVAALSYALYRHRWAAVGAAVGVALSPFAVLFSATAFTDPLMVALGLGSCVASARGRGGWAGLLAGLAFAAKQTGLVWAPLALALGLIQAPPFRPRAPTRSGLGSPPGRWPSVLRPWSSVIRHASAFVPHLSLAMPFLLVVGLAFVWDGVRMAHGAESFWHMGVTGYGGLRLIWPQELWARLRDWMAWARYLFVAPLVNGALLVGLPALVWRATIRCRCARDSLTDLMLVSFLMIYALLHWLWAFPVWDRYLLPLVPVLAVLLGRLLSLLAAGLQPRLARISFVSRPWSSLLRLGSSFIVHCSLFLLLLLPAWGAARGRYPIGIDHGTYDGIDAVATFLRGLPEGSVVYHHWLGWHYADYLFGAPVYLAYWPTPAWLAQDVRIFGTAEPRYITFPSWESPARVEMALAEVGYRLEPVLATTRRDGTRSFTVYQVQPLSSP